MVFIGCFGARVNGFFGNCQLIKLCVLDIYWNDFCWKKIYYKYNFVKHCYCFASVWFFFCFDSLNAGCRWWVHRLFNGFFFLRIFELLCWPLRRSVALYVVFFLFLCGVRCLVCVCVCVAFASSGCASGRGCSSQFNFENYVSFNLKWLNELNDSSWNFLTLILINATAVCIRILYAFQYRNKNWSGFDWKMYFFRIISFIWRFWFCHFHLIQWNDSSRNPVQ